MLHHMIHKPLFASTFQELLDTELDAASQPETLQTTVSLQAPQVTVWFLHFGIVYFIRLISICRGVTALFTCYSSVNARTLFI